MAQYTLIFHLISLVMLCEYGTTVRDGGRGNFRRGFESGVRSRDAAQGMDGGHLITMDLELVSRVIAALDSSISYYENNFKQMNFDGIFGAKVVEGQLNLIVAEYNKGFLSATMDSFMRNKVASIATRAGRVVKLAIPYLYKKNRKYMGKMERLFQLSWDVGHSHRNVDMSLKWSDRTFTLALEEELTEVQSDHCIAELLEPIEGVMCRMTDVCQQMMTKAGRERYALVHQILYTVVAEMSGCGSRLERWLVRHDRSGSIEQLQGEMCSNLYSEALTLTSVAFSDNVLNNRDLLMEMEFVCGMLGYVEFLWRDWLADILDWQSKSGCFSSTKPHVAIGRKLLREEKLPDGCLQHLTTVAVSALAVHLHYLLYPGIKSRGASSLKHVSPPSAMLEPPHESIPMHIAGGFMLNQPLYREEVQDGLSRVAEEEKSLEDKADIVMKHLEEKRNSTKHSHVRDFMSPLSHYDSTSKSNSGPVPLPEHPLHQPQYLASTHTSGTTVETSMAAFYFVIASIVLVMLVMVRYVHSGRRTHTIFRTRFRF
ncbi:UPF0764 protein C16orf89 homolog [Penaeus monodon]|uniref:UPF0764 protein C16orf89 homolog n=1 Tax=Penaeus monodon TaxID=6687 RepID=UPI0018A77588|nr:UPF0764 protein C16orf89 homolog [Penaeus monodon]